MNRILSGGIFEGSCTAHDREGAMEWHKGKKDQRRESRSLKKPHPLYILLIEDDPVRPKSFATLCNPPVGCQVKVRGSAPRVSRYDKRTVPDIAFIDLNLPDGNALDILTSPADAGSFPIVVVTAHGDESIAVKVMNSRCSRLCREVSRIVQSIT